MRARLCLIMIVAGAFCSVTPQSGATSSPGASDSYQANGRRILVDHFMPPAQTKVKGAAVVLHGAGGLLFDGPRVRRVARALAADGYDVSLIHYFDRTGTIFARDPGMQRDFATWFDTIRLGIDQVYSTRGHGRPVYVYGYSLGAFLALAAASDNPEVAAVAEHAGGIWNNERKRLGHMPPVLMIHGMADERVPLKKYADPLRADLRRKGGLVKTHFYAGQGHVFSKAALVEVEKEVPRFFDAVRVDATLRGR